MDGSDWAEEDLLTGTLNDTERHALVHAVRFFGVLDESEVADSELGEFLSASIFLMDANREAVRMTHLVVVLQENRRFARELDAAGQRDISVVGVDSD